jgi:hypothetical protein
MWNLIGVEGPQKCLELKKDEVLLTQQELIESLAQQHRVSGLRHSLPLDPQYFVQRTELEEGCNKTRFQQIIGGLLFIARMT